MTEPRRYLTPKQKAEVLLRHNGRCAICGHKFAPGDKIEFDHTQALCLGGTNDLDNMRPVCGGDGCHREKTRADVKANAKGKRQRKKFGGLRGLPVPEPRFKKPIPSRGFPKDIRQKLRGGHEPRVGNARMG